MEKNELYPIFLKVSNLNVLIVGGGNVGLEKLTFLLKSSPNAQVQMVAPEFLQDTLDLAQKHSVEITKAEYRKEFLKGKHIVVACTDKVEVNEQVYHDCRERSILVNVADNPPYCDFYMGGIVTKGNVKVAISTNGKSPTTAKRLRQFFEDVLPENIDDLVKNLNAYRDTLKGNFEEKVEALNEFTKGLLDSKPKKSDQ
ncbi:bifunctional precorrin-2 dehydrogenase/sirohydrochlorin ferrochelatase [Muricauda sp. CAU 1633]|uniref:precorrin-2 dehydrogenase/sirohydrochlorin ferrochelatase family protein n=1 Tax=Allomuricauda sp. CAU 1633 TaxID=2816036 RepID=UPI001A8E098E|nr:bifunctional precorrin-2 dehydrogenase/sirohydrochlorin ferrochelatase [Muricauda sp. CAU 1633]MBO0323875.1 bifunctional precorrin-2 dehydrogenase/sirohydrochlorin ferrochelatase [Muricauda sp. CAU 1633]